MIVYRNCSHDDICNLRCAVIYISGPITGIENWKENFLAAQKALDEEEMNFCIVNPVEISNRLDTNFEKLGFGTPDYADYMRKDIEQLVSCDAVCMLPGWKRSRGARLEYRIAKILNMQVLEFKPEQ